MLMRTDVVRESDRPARFLAAFDRPTAPHPVA
jgi:hypothetical protein